MTTAGSDNRNESRKTARREKEESKVGAGLFPSRHDSIHHMGHMWIRWQDPLTHELHHRGYWPVLSDVPDSLSNDEVRGYLIKNAVRGLFKVDKEGNEKEVNENCRNKDWNFSERAFFRLSMQRCYLPQGVTYRLSGKYSCNEQLEDTDNCCSWAVRSLRHAREDNNFIPCDRIKRLKYVEIALWGNNVY